MRPLTGKTHQLRVALRALAAPIVGDPLYHPADPALSDRCPAPSRLHAQRSLGDVPRTRCKPPLPHAPHVTRRPGTAAARQVLLARLRPAHRGPRGRRRRRRRAAARADCAAAVGGAALLLGGLRGGVGLARPPGHGPAPGPVRHGPRRGQRDPGVPVRVGAARRRLTRRVRLAPPAGPDARAPGRPGGRAGCGAPSLPGSPASGSSRRLPRSFGAPLRRRQGRAHQCGVGPDQAGAGALGKGRPGLCPWTPLGP